MQRPPQASRRGRPAAHRRPYTQPPNARAHPRQRPARRSFYNLKTLLVVGTAGSLILGGLCVLMLLAGFGLLYSAGHILPGVNSAGVDLGHMDEAEATAALQTTWANQGIQLRDNDRIWQARPQDIGIELDAAATAAQAREWGRSRGGVSGALRSMARGVDIEPVLNIDLAILTGYLTNTKAAVDVPAKNAGIQLVNGQAAATPPVDGRTLDVSATVDHMRTNAAEELADGALDLVMVPVAPAIRDSSALVGQANALLSSPFTVAAYDPIRDEQTTWSAPPDVWAAWLTAASALDTTLSLAIDAAGPTAFLQANGQFPDERYIKADEAVSAMQNAVGQGQTTVTIRVWHQDTTYTVSAGQTLASIAEEVGIPYPYIQAANPGINIDALYSGQSLTLPSKDILVPLPLIPNKRIVVSRSQQHLWAYENGQVVFDWVISTGLSSSPTALGIFQVQSHELNAYADQWNLYMPHFMGFYHPGPNMDLMNGFHGFPTRGGGYLLWSGDLGHPVTYGCILLSLENAEALYNWAEEGVVVEVRS